MVAKVVVAIPARGTAAVDLQAQGIAAVLRLVTARELRRSSHRGFVFDVDVKLDRNISFFFLFVLCLV
jgi:hypothetical protein